MTKQEAIEIIDQAHKGNCVKENFFKTPYEIISETLDKYAKAVNKNSVLVDVIACPKCENPYPHRHRNNRMSCEECGNVWDAV